MYDHGQTTLLRDIFQNYSRFGFLLGSQATLEMLAIAQGIGVLLKNQGKLAHIYYSGGSESLPTLKLPGADLFIKDLPDGKVGLSFAGINDCPIASVGYYTKNNRLSIVVTPERVGVVPYDLRLESQINPWEVAIVLGNGREFDQYATRVLNLVSCQIIQFGSKIPNTEVLPTALLVEKPDAAPSLSSWLLSELGNWGMYPDVGTTSCFLFALGLNDSSQTQSEYVQ